MSTSPSSTTKPINEKNHGKNLQQQKSRKRKLARARRPRGEFDSDEEMEREHAAGSDSDSHFSEGSATESESAGSDLDEGTSLRSGHKQASSPPTPVAAPPKRQETSSPGPAKLSWSDAVQESLTNDTTDLPVIDFGDFRMEETHHEREHSPSPEPVGQASSSQPSQPLQPTIKSRPQPPTSPPRPYPRTSARQAYQERLTNDPSFVPVVGEFWGHDDRLMDKELRSLSGWWRGRWQGRGRGGWARGWAPSRGGPPMRGRFGPTPEQEEDLPPVDKTWSHDGFEELSKTEDRRSYGHPRRGWRGNKMQNNFHHKRSNPSPLASDSRPRTPINPTARAQAQAAAQGRPWFAKKPERIWTKQFDGFLYVDPELKTSSKGQSIRVRFRPGAPMVIPLSESLQPKVDETTPEAETQSIGRLVVRLPGQRGHVVEETHGDTLQVEPVITYEEPPLVPTAVHQHEFPSFDHTQSVGLPDVLQGARSADFSSTGSHASPFEGQQYPPAFQPPIDGTPDVPSFSSPIYYNPAFDFGSAGPGVYYSEVGYPADPHRPSYYMQTTQSPYGRPPTHPQVLVQPEMVHYHPVQPEYMVYPDTQALQFSLPRRSAKIQIRAPKDIERAVLVNPSAIPPSTDELVEQQHPNPPYYPAISTSADPASLAGSEEQMSQAVPYGEVHYYNPYGYSYMNPYEGYDDGRRVYY